MYLEINASYGSFYWVHFKCFQLDLSPNEKCEDKGQILQMKIHIRKLHLRQ